MATGRQNRGTVQKVRSEEPDLSPGPPAGPTQKYTRTWSQSSWQLSLIIRCDTILYCKALYSLWGFHVFSYRALSTHHEVLAVTSLWEGTRKEQSRIWLELLRDSGAAVPRASQFKRREELVFGPSLAVHSVWFQGPLLDLCVFLIHKMISVLRANVKVFHCLTQLSWSVSVTRLPRCEEELFTPGAMFLQDRFVVL